MTFTLNDLRDYQQHYKSPFLRNLTSVIESYFAAADIAHKLTEKTRIVLNDPVRFDLLDAELYRLLNSKSGKRALANFIGWKIIKRNTVFLSEKYRDQLQTPMPPNCLALVKGVFPQLLEILFIRDNIPNEVKEKVIIYEWLSEFPVLTKLKEYFLTSEGSQVIIPDLQIFSLRYRI